MEPFQKPGSRDMGRTTRRFEQIVGNSRALEAVLAQVERVAVTDTTALILGETGTGKELIARAIHNISPRCGRPFIKLNCAAIPFDLLESELFGHEKGAFTGAIAQRLGRFELADTGTLFLDEVGDIPLALQPKLLRVLQEQEFERLGSEKTRHVNVRLVAATHRDLPQMVKQNRFRSDLFYRLHVFPVRLPALRERREDIAALVMHYVELFGQRMGKRIESVPPETMASFKSYSWPGNVRELQNLVERAVILSNDGVLHNPLQQETPEGVAEMSPGTALRAPIELLGRTEQFTSVEPRSLAQAQIEHILNVLKETNWVIGGPNGAAARLALKRTTLIGKMNKLGLSRSAAASVLF
jgi:formate hydrogenlyase transcriptional activator